MICILTKVPVKFNKRFLISILTILYQIRNQENVTKFLKNHRIRNQKDLKIFQSSFDYFIRYIYICSEGLSLRSIPM